MVGIPTVGRRDSLRDAIESVVAQTYSDWCVLVSDNSNSEDVRRLVESFHDPRVRYVGHVEDLGYVGNWNYLLSTGDTEFVSVLHDDDRYLPEYLERMVGALDANPGANWAFSNAYYITVQDGRHQLWLSNQEDELFPRKGRLFAALMFVTCVLSDSVVLRRSFPGEWRIPSHYEWMPDRAFFLELAAHHDAAYVATPLMEYSLSADSGSLVYQHGHVYNCAEELRYVHQLLARRELLLDGNVRRRLRARRPFWALALIAAIARMPAETKVHLVERPLEGLTGPEIVFCRWLLRSPRARRVIDLSLNGALRLRRRLQRRGAIRITRTI